MTLTTRVVLIVKGKMMTPEEKPEVATHWKCHKCGYLAVAAVIHYAKHDYGCPRCATPFRDFVAHNEEGSDDT